MKITQIDLNGKNNSIVFRVEFNHAKRPLPNKHDVSIDSETIENIVKNGGYFIEEDYQFIATTTKEAIAGLINYQLIKANELRVKEESLPEFTKPEELPDLKLVNQLIGICLDEKMQSRVFVKNDEVFIASGWTEDEKKMVGKRLTADCDPPDDTYIKQICALVHTPEVKARLLAEKPKVQKTRKAMKEFTRYEVKDGKAIQIIETKEVDEPVFNELPVVDTDGNLILDTGGNPMPPYLDPVME